MTFKFTDPSNKPGRAKTLEVSLGSAELLHDVGNSMCMLALMPGPVGFDMWILGDSFLRQVYTVHNPQDFRVVLFPRAHTLSMALARNAEVNVHMVVSIAALMALVSAGAFWARWRRRVTVATGDVTDDDYIRL